MLLGAGGLATGALVDPGPGVEEEPGAHGFATVAEAPAVCEVPAVVEVEPMPLLVEELVLVEGVPVVVPLAPGVVVLPEAVVLLEVVVPGVVVLLLEPMPVVLFEGVQGAVVVLIPDWPCVVPWFWVPSVPPVVEPALPATPGVPGLAAGDPVEVAPGVVVVVPLWPAVPVVVPVVPVVVPGWDVLVPVVCDPIPGLGVADPEVWAVATPKASAKTDDANRTFRMEACSLSECRGSISFAAKCEASVNAFLMGCLLHLPEMGQNESCSRIYGPISRWPESSKAIRYSCAIAIQYNHFIQESLCGSL